MMSDSIFDKDLPAAEVPLFEELVKRYFRGPLKADVHTEGQQVEDGFLTLGCRAGPGISVKNLLHEMSHFTEIDDARVMSPGWGLRVGKMHHMFGKTWFECGTGECIRRELRVGAFQYNFGADLGYYLDKDSFVAEYVQVMRFMPFDALCSLASEEDCYKPTSSNPDGRVVDYETACEKVLNHLLDSGNYSPDTFNAEWNRKLTKLVA